MPAKLIEGNLFESPAKYIVHQCNCITWRSAHLAQDMFRRFPWSDIYTSRRDTHIEDMPGEIIIRGSGQDQRYVIAILGQKYPGKPRFQTGIDCAEMRQKYFHGGLKKILEIKNIESIAFPYAIGCGVAGGNWEFYQEQINRFADVISEVDVSIVKLIV